MAETAEALLDNPSKGPADGSESLGQAMAAVAELLYRAPGRYGFISPDEAAEVFLRYGKRLTKIAEKQATLSPGESGAYRDTCLRYLAKSLRRDKRCIEQKEAACECLEEWKARDEACGWGDEGRDRYGAPLAKAAVDGLADLPPRYVLERSDPESRRVVFLFLKCAWEADDELAAKVARKAGVPVPWLTGMAERARSHLEGDRARLDTIRERTNAAWLRMRVTEGRLAEEPVKSRRKELEQRLHRDKTRFGRLLETRAAFRPVVPNSVVADILGIPKGTVDSGIYYLRKGRALSPGDDAG